MSQLPAERVFDTVFERIEAATARSYGDIAIAFEEIEQRLLSTIVFDDSDWR